MKRPKLLYTLLIALMSLLIVDDIQAQRRSTSSRRTTNRSRAQDDSKLAEQWLAISLGNIQFGSGFSLSTKFSYGFEFEDRFSVGASGKLLYDFVNRFSPTPDLHLLTYGIGPFARIKIVEEFFVIGEFNYNSIDQGPTRFRLNTWSPSVGAGYKSGVGNWSYGLHILYPFDEQVRDYYGLEYWIDFNYKF